MKKRLASVSAFFSAAFFLFTASQSQAQFFFPSFPAPEIPSIQTRWEIHVPVMHFEVDEFAGFREITTLMNFDPNATHVGFSYGRKVDVPTDASFWEVSNESNGVNGNGARVLHLRSTSNNPVQFNYAFEFNYANPTLPGTRDKSGSFHFIGHNDFGDDNPTSLSADSKVAYYEDYNYPGSWGGGTYRGFILQMVLSFDQITGKTQLSTGDGIVLYEETLKSNDAGQFTLFGVSFDMERKKAVFPIRERQGFWEFETYEHDFLFTDDL